MQTDLDFKNYTGVIIEDPRDNGYTAFILELPEVIAGGFDKEEVRRNLALNLKLVLDYRKKEDILNTYTIQGYKAETFPMELTL